MTPSEKRIAIAELCGWRKREHGYWSRNGRLLDISKEPPDFLVDLNACARMECSLTHDECTKYHKELENQIASDAYERDGEFDYPAQEFWFHSTADQRCDAFLIAKGILK